MIWKAVLERRERPREKNLQVKEKPNFGREKKGKIRKGKGRYIKEDYRREGKIKGKGK
jgi:hypothetical protein